MSIFGIKGSVSCTFKIVCWYARNNEDNILYRARCSCITTGKSELRVQYISKCVLNESLLKKKPTGRSWTSPTNAADAAVSRELPAELGQPATTHTYIDSEFSCAHSSLMNTYFWIWFLWTIFFLRIWPFGKVWRK